LSRIWNGLPANARRLQNIITQHATHVFDVQISQNAILQVAHDKFSLHSKILGSILIAANELIRVIHNASLI